VVATALAIGVLAEAVARILAGEEQQVEPVGPEVVLEPDEDLVEEGVLEVGVPLARVEEDPMTCERWVTSIRAAAVGVCSSERASWRIRSRVSGLTSL
jgi:hypothetical protein